jgi:3-carboxy-cis,cis-muconate cycloisomerase
MFSTPAMTDAVGAEAWLRAMLRFEAALATAEGDNGLIPAEMATRVSDFCAQVKLDPARIGDAARAAANPGGPFVQALKEAAPDGIAGYIHRGATSQDVLDTAMVLVSRDALGVLGRNLDRLAAASAELAQKHRSTLILGRTLLQPAVPITFGLKAAGWLSATVDSRKALSRWLREDAALQFGGAAGTLASLGIDGFAVATALGEELELRVPATPWHTSRGRVLRLAAALVESAGVAGKVALDIVLLAQAEVAEVTEGGAPGAGRSSTMPQKRNPSAAVSVIAAARRASALLSLFSGSLLQEHERAAGAWQAEWPTLCDLFLLTDVAVSGMAGLLENLEVNDRRMEANLKAQGGLSMAEAVVAGLTRATNAGHARTIVEAAIARAAATGCSFREAILGDSEAVEAVGASALVASLEPANYLGSTNEFIDRALASWRERI